MAVKRKTSANKAQSNAKLTVDKRLGVIHIDTVTIRENKNGNKYIPTPFGAVYSRLDEVKAGQLYTVVQLSNEMLALNRTTAEEKMSFISEIREKHPGWTVKDIMDFYGI